MLEQLLIKHGFNNLSPELENGLKAFAKEVVQKGWFAGVNYANDQADGVVDGHPDRKEFMKKFVGDEQG